jgi:hypothetical protein
MNNLESIIKNLSNDSKLILYIFITLFVIWIIFDPIKYIWANDPFQKVILAPLGEEPFKLLLAFLLCSVLPVENHLIKRFSKNKSKSNVRNRNLIRNLNFPTIFSDGFIPFSIVAAVSFGVGEGPYQNIVLHVSSSSLAAILIVVVFKRVKHKHWKLRYKLLSIVSTISLPMIIHSVSNQYANIGYANNHPEFEYLVVIGRFLENYTFLNSQAMFTVVVFGLTYIIFTIWLYWNIIIPLYQKRKNNRIVEGGTHGKEKY